MPKPKVATKAAVSWRPIETAPKDGRKIIYLNGDEVSTCRWSSPDTDHAFEEDWDAEWWNDHTNQGARPKYWMPLPPPPGDTK